MQKTLLLFIAACLLYYASAKAQPANARSAYIYGRVAGFKKHLDSANSIAFDVENMVKNNAVVYNAKLKNDGSFSINIPLHYTQSIYFEYNDHLVTILVSPDKQLQFNFNADDPEHTEVFDGSGAPENIELAKYNAVLNKQWRTWYGGKDNYERYRQLNKAQTSDEPVKYKEYVLERYRKERAFTEEYLKANNASSLFAQWAKNNLKYECASSLLDYLWTHKASHEIYMPDGDYFEFIRLFELSNADALITPNYNRYLNEYSNYLMSKNFGKEQFDPERLITLFKQEAPLARDILLSQFFYGLIEAKDLDAFAIYKKQLNASIVNSWLKEDLFKAYQHELTIRNNAKMPQNAKIGKVPPSGAGNAFSKIVAKYPNKVIYFDFWATWCGPCRTEMPNSKALQAKLKGKDVVYVYLCVESQEKTWKSSIAELGIEGEHYLVNNNDYKELAAKFQINGIPHYVLVNRKGIVYDANAKRPGDVKLKDDIETLLVAK